MAWNGSNQSGNPRKIVVVGARKSPIKWKLIAGYSLAAVCVIVVLVFSFIDVDVKEPNVEEPKAKKQTTIAEVPAAVVRPVETQIVEKVIDPNARPTKVGEVVNGYVLLPSGRMHHRTGVITNSAASRPKGKYAIFSRSCNNEIAAYLTLRPGDTLVGTPRYNGRFVKDFLESIKEPIIVTAEDTPEQAEFKRSVIAARQELKDAYDRGEDIEKIMLDTRTELQDLMRVKQEYKKLFNDERRKCETDQDVEDLYNACNKLLEEKGIAPLTYGPITKRNLLRAQQNELNQ